VRVTGRVSVAALAEEFAVAAETIRRDLLLLERHGLLRRVYGGALPVDPIMAEPEITARAQMMAEEKRRIAVAALAELPDGGSIFIEGGSTPAALAEALPPDRRLTVVTTGLLVALALARQPNLTVLAVGGRVRTRTLATVEDWAQQVLAGVHVDVAFLGTNGLDVHAGLTTPDTAEAAIKRLALSVGRRSVLLADHTKIGAVSMCRYGDLPDVDVLITDNGAAADTIEALAATGLKVVTA
jgi:DeoR family fructose operon transcriptional repressor